MVSKFTILGERCSGTNFLEKAILENFDINITWEYGWKHFFGFNEYNNNDDTLFIGIVRDPYQWINSLYKIPYHLPKKLRKKENFLTGEFFSLYRKRKNLPQAEIMEDRNIYTRKRYKNIFECRKVKCQFLLDDIKHKVKNYILIRYEDLRDNYDETLDTIKDNFSLIKKHDKYTPIINRVSTNTGFIIETIETFDKNVINLYLDKDIEKRLNYLQADKDSEEKLNYPRADKDSEEKLNYPQVDNDIEEK